MFETNFFFSQNVFRNGKECVFKKIKMKCFEFAYILDIMEVKQGLNIFY